MWLTMNVCNVNNVHFVRSGFDNVNYRMGMDVLHLFPDNLHLFPIPETCKWPPKRRFANVPHTKDLQMAPKTEICKCSPFQRLSNVPLPKIGNLQMFPIPEICKWPPKRRFANVPHEQNWEHSFCFIKPYLSYLT